MKKKAQNRKYKVEFVTDNPKKDKVKNGIIYIVRNKVGKKYYQKWAFLKCPDGCGDVLMLSLMSEDEQNWKLGIDYLKRPSLSPSINKIDGCRSHFWLKRGKIIWHVAKYD